jgi:hypothetical protein
MTTQSKPDSLDVVLKKIEEQKVTVSDFNQLISESTPEAIRDRLRRRTLKSETESHIDNKTGHQGMSLPHFQKRVAPKRKPENQQNHGRSKVANRHSQRTQARQRAATESTTKPSANTEPATTPALLEGTGFDFKLSRDNAGLTMIIEHNGQELARAKHNKNTNKWDIVKPTDDQVKCVSLVQFDGYDWNTLFGAI